MKKYLRRCFEKCRFSYPPLDEFYSEGMLKRVGGYWDDRVDVGDVRWDDEESVSESFF